MGVHYVDMFGKVVSVVGFSAASTSGQKFLEPGFKEISFFLEPGSRKIRPLQKYAVLLSEIWLGTWLYCLVVLSVNG